MLQGLLETWKKFKKFYDLKFEHLLSLAQSFPL